MYQCGCGRMGCLETFASSTAIIHYAKYLISSGNNSMMSDMVQGHLENISGEIIFEMRAKNGDAVANEVVNELLKLAT